MVCSPLAEIANELNIKVVINVSTNIQNLPLLGFPTYKNSFSFFGITIFKPSIFKFLFTSLVPRIDTLVKAISNNLVLVNSSFALEDPIALPPNINVVGLPFEN